MSEFRYDNTEHLLTGFQDASVKTGPLWSMLSINLWPAIEHVHGRRAHSFTCAKPGCGQTIRRFLDTGDRKSTGNMRKHVLKCWGRDALESADELRTAKAARESVNVLGRSGSISAAFAAQGARTKVMTYSTQQHTRTQMK